MEGLLAIRSRANGVFALVYKSIRRHQVAVSAGDRGRGSNRAFSIYGEGIQIKRSRTATR